MKNLVFILFHLTSIPLSAQISFYDQERYRLNVKQPDEFIQRFNGEAYPELTIDCQTETIRQTAILSLFDQNLIHKARENDTLRYEMEEFVKTVVQTGLYLEFMDPNWYAQTLCSAMFNGQDTSITYTLKTSIDTNRVAQWKVLGAKAGFLNFDTSAVKEDQVLTPVSHNLNFMKLSTVLNKPENHPLDFVYQGFKPNDLSMAMYLSELGILKLNVVDKLVFHFLNVDGWVFTIQNFERNEDNAGWLISSLERLPEKGQYLRGVLHIDPGYLKQQHYTHGSHFPE